MVAVVVCAAMAMDFTTATVGAMAVNLIVAIVTVVVTMLVVND